MSDFSSLLRRRRTLLAVGFACVVATAAWLWLRQPHETDAEFDNPRLALGALHAEQIYFNPAALPWLIAQRPELLSAEDRDPQSERARSFAQAILEPKLFRQLDRQSHFDAVLLIGDPSQYRPLLDHLTETKDFALVYVDHAALIFRRGAAQPWSLSDFESVRAAFQSASKSRRANLFSLAAVKLAAARRSPEAKSLIDEALALDSDSATAWSALGSYELERGEWAAALAATERALAIDKEHLGALGTRTQAFVATKRFNEAYALSQRLIAHFPDDPNLLFKHAQIAHEAHAYTTEITALEKLISIAEAQGRPSTGYRFYLAQAQTAAGNGQPALDNFARVLSDPDLPADQRKFALETIERIKHRTGL